MENLAADHGVILSARDITHTDLVRIAVLAASNARQHTSKGFKNRHSVELIMFVVSVLSNEQTKRPKAKR